MKSPFLLFICASIVTAASPENPVVERVGGTAFIQVPAESFNSLTPREKALAYWLTQAAIAIDPIIYDQRSRFGLRQKRRQAVEAVGGDLYERCGSESLDDGMFRGRGCDNRDTDK